MSSFIRTGWLLAGPGTGLLRRPGEPHAISWLAGAGLVVLLAGCAGQASVALPPKTGVQSPARLAEQVSQRQQVMDAYAGYWQASGEALNSGNARRASQILARYAPATALPGLIAALRQDWARHAVTDGVAVLHVISVKIRGGRATVHDCVDLSHARLPSGPDAPWLGGPLRKRRRRARRARQWRRGRRCRHLQAVPAATGLSVPV